MREIKTTIKLTTNNLHLKDIFFSNHYIELGSIDINVIERLLNYEIVNIENITYFPIQNKGLGKSRTTNEKAQNYLPFLFFKDCYTKTKNKQLFITYGILEYMGVDKKEIFLPIILIPICLYYEDSHFLVQMQEKPFENPVLFNIFNDMSKFKFLGQEKLCDIYSLDKVVLSFNKISGFKVKLENYLTFASIKKNDIIIDHNRFTKDKIGEQFATKLYTDTDDLFYSELLTKEQRTILLKAIDGQNIIFNGRIGTGKTTVLKNIVVNLINKGKRILYISNMDETLQSVQEFMKKNNLGNYVANLSNSFASLIDNSLEYYPKKTIEYQDIKNDLQQHYEYIDQYEKQMGSRISDFRLIEVIDELSFLSDINKNKIDIDDLSDIYKNEYTNILNALEKIQTNLYKIDSFKESIWKEIPVINKVRYPNQILVLINQIYKCFKELISSKEKLEQNYGFIEISNYAMIKKIMYYMEGFDPHMIPSNWQDETGEVYRQANEEFRNVKTLIYSLQETEYYLQHKYDKLNKINIEEEIKDICGEYHTLDDIKEIDKIICNKNLLMQKISRAEIQRDVFFRKAHFLGNVCEWAFYKKDEELNEFIRFVNFLTDNRVERRMINIVMNKHCVGLIAKIKKIISEIEQLTLLKDSFDSKYGVLTEEEQKHYLDLANKESESQQPVKRDSQLKKKFSTEKIESIIELLSDNIENIKKIKRRKQEYFDLLKSNYGTDDAIVKDIDNLKEYLDSITNLTYKKYITNFLVKQHENSLRSRQNWNDIIKDMNIFRKSYYELDDFLNSMQEYKLFNTQDCFYDCIKQSKIIFTYLKNVFNSNQKIQDVMKSLDGDYVSVEIYLDIRDKQNEKEKIISELKNNQKFSTLYGELYKEEYTDITLLSKVLQGYAIYSENYIDRKCLNESFTKFEQISEILVSCKRISDEINEIFKMYCRIFKDGVSRYYYNSFGKTLEYLEALLEAKDELLIYLSISSGIGVLNDYKLNKLINYIINTPNCENIVNDFNYVYFCTLQEKFLSKYDLIGNTNLFIEKINETIELEKQIMSLSNNKTIANIQRNSGLKLNLRGIKNLDYNRYMYRTIGIKHLILSPSNIVDTFVDIDNFDVVIIDDAHLLEANEYTYSLVGKQIIICGEYQLHTSVSNSLIARMRTENILLLDYRFETISKKYLTFIQRLKSQINISYSENLKIEIVEKDIVEYIVKLYENNNNVVINYFVENIDYQRTLYEVLCEYLIVEKGFTFEDTIEFFKNNINISDVANGYILDADYNILDLRDYIYVDSEYLTANILENLLLCRKEVIIYDSINYLSLEMNTNFYYSIKSIVNKTDVFETKLYDGVTRALAENIKQKGYNIFSSNDNVSFFVKKNDTLIPVLVFWDNENIDEILNIYRDINNVYKKVLFVSKYELIYGIERMANIIIEEINE